MQDTVAVEPKEIILNAAEKLIAEHGYAGFSIRELSRESDLAKGTIYYHFRDKRDIYRSVMQRALERLEACLIQAIQTEATPVRRLRQVVDVYLSLAYERRSLMLALMREMGNMEGELHEIAQCSRETILAPVTSLLQDGMQTGKFRTVSLDVATMTLFGTMNAYIGQQILMDKEPPDEHMIDQILDFFLYGLVLGKEEAR